MNSKSGRGAYCDFHLYTTRSGGSYTAEELVKACVKEGNIRAISITDRKAVCSKSQLISLSETYQVKMIPGVELPCVYTLAMGKQKEISIVGYHVDPEHPNLQEVLKETRWPLSFYRACQAILASGGVPVLAHLYHYQGLDDWDRDLLVKDFAQCTRGRGGMEVLCAGYDEQQRQKLAETARYYHLVPSAGSGFCREGEGICLNNRFPMTICEGLEAKWLENRNQIKL